MAPSQREEEEEGEGEGGGEASAMKMRRLRVKVRWEEQERTFGPFPLRDLRLENLRTKVQETFLTSRDSTSTSRKKEKEKDLFFEFTDGDTLVDHDEVLQGLALQLLERTKANASQSILACPCLLLFVFCSKESRKRERLEEEEEEEKTQRQRRQREGEKASSIGVGPREEGTGTGMATATPCMRERISFVPHPRTITAAGDLEYFTSSRTNTGRGGSGRETTIVSYALAELVDNALSATQHLTCNRKIKIVFLVKNSSSSSSSSGVGVGGGPKGPEGCIFIEDNGVGMNKRQLNEWAVMNLSKSERREEGTTTTRTRTTGGGGRESTSGSGNHNANDDIDVENNSSFWGSGGTSQAGLTQTQTQTTQHPNRSGRGRGKPPPNRDRGGSSWGHQHPHQQNLNLNLNRKPRQDRFLFSSLSFFGVGSKNAAFFLGNSVHVATKPKGNCFVHDLHLCANELEAKYRNRENVYEADLIHREPGDISTLTDAEKRFKHSVQAVVNEGEEEGEGEGEGNVSINRNDLSFTRLTVSDLKEDVTSQIKDKYGCEQICRDLAHIYHFYIHGPEGFKAKEQPQEPLGSGSGACTTTTTTTTSTSTLPDGSALPEISVEFYRESQLLLKRNLMDVEDDQVSLHLQSQKSEFLFSLEVPERGCVDGILYYFPFESERETMPALESSSSSPQGTPLMTQQRSQYDFTQVSMTQFNNHQSQFSVGGDQDSAAAAAFAAAMQAPRRSSLFETFWQGRLIPESRVASLPFIDAIFQRKGTYMRDKIPPEVIHRIWGCLFFGPEFRVTRNKLSFRDNLEDLLCSSFSSNRNTEKKFKDWLAKCHTELDQTISFEKMCPLEMQAEMRKRLGENKTYFDRVVMSDETETNLSLCTGDVVQLKTAPKVVGRISCLLANKVMHKDGRHSSGLLAIQQIPEEIYGKENLVLYPLRRFKSKLNQKEVEELIKKQWNKAPCRLSIEPLHLATGKTQSFSAGESFPSAYVSISNGLGQRITRGILGGTKQNLSIVQKLYYVGPEEVPSGNPEVEAGASQAVMQTGDQERTKARPAKNLEELLCVSNCTPRSDLGFGFQKVNGGFKKTGHYLMRFSVEPNKAGRSPLVLEVNCFVRPCEPERMELEWESEVCLQEVRLGQSLPSLSLLLFDEFDNQIQTSSMSSELTQVDVAVEVEHVDAELGVEKEMVDSGDGKVNLRDIRLVPQSSPESPHKPPLPFFSTRGRNRMQAKPNPLRCKLLIKAGNIVKEIPKVQLFPGLPSSFDIVNGIDMDSNSEENPLQLAQDSPFPSFAIELRDEFGNRTFPPPARDFTYTLNVKCDGLLPESKQLAIEENGVLHVEGFVAESSLCTRAILQLQCAPTGSIPETCTNSNNSISEKVIWVQIEPSAKPAGLAMLRSGQEIAGAADGSDDYVIDDVQVAASLDDLSVEIRDACGRAACCGTSAKLTCSWVKGTREVQVTRDSQITLPPLMVQDNCGSVVSFWIRVVVDSIHLEKSVVVKASPGPPYSWALSCESNKVQSGVPFDITIEAVDKYQNRCRCSCSQLPTPVIQPESDRDLTFRVEDWQTEWNCDEDSMYTYSARLVLFGEQGPITLRVHGENDLKMSEDVWHVPLLPGPPSKLSLLIPNRNQVFYTQCFIETVVAEVRDSYGNFVPCNDFEVVLRPSAISSSVEGLSGNISSKKGNRKKIVDGKAEFNSVKVSCPKAGKYTLQANCGSRKLSIEEASLEIDVQHCNKVTKLSTDLPEKTLVAGGCIDINVDLETENGDPLPRELALGKVEVIITLNDQSTRSEEPCTVSSRVVEYSEDKLSIQFVSEKVTLAGTYNVTAVYEETRSELASVMASNQLKVRSLSTAFEVKPFEPKQLSLLPLEAESSCTILHVSDKTASTQPVIESAVMQLQDCYGNFVAKPKCSLSIHLYEDENLEREMEGALAWEGVGSLATDKAGKASIGDIKLVEGALSGLSEEATHDMHLVVYCKLSKKQERFVGWRRTLTYSNDEKHAAMKEECTKEKRALERQVHELKKSADKELEMISMQKAKLRTLQETQASKLEIVGGEGDQDFEKLLKEQEGKLKAAEKKGKRKPVVRSLLKFKASLELAKSVSPEHCTGWFVEQATVEQDNLARILSWFRRGKLQVLIMATMESMNAVRRALKQKRLEIPDMIAEEAMRAYDPSRTRRKTSCKVTSAEAALHGQLGLLSKKLHEDSLLGSDEALSMGLPHHYVDKQRWPEDLKAWPPGFVGHAANLLRPRELGKRRTILYTLVGSALVFDEWQNAYKYFKLCRTQLHLEVPTTFNLDGTCVESDGVLTGSKNQCPQSVGHLKIALGSSSAVVSKQYEFVRKKVSALKNIIELNRSIDELGEKLKRDEQSFKVSRVAKKEQLKVLKASLREVNDNLSKLSRAGGGGGGGEEEEEKQKKGSHQRPVMGDLDPNSSNHDVAAVNASVGSAGGAGGEENQEQVPSSERKRPSPNGQEGEEEEGNRLRSSRRRRLIYEMED